MNDNYPNYVSNGTSSLYERAEELFKFCNKDHKEYITKEDIRRLATVLPLSEEQLDAVFDSLDNDGNGFLTPDEFTNGFGSFMGELPEPDAAGYTSQIDEKNVFESTDDADNQLERFRSMIHDTGADSIIPDVSSIRSLWLALSKHEPQMLSSFEDFLQRVSHDLQHSQLEFASLESTLRSKSSEHDADIQKLYEEMEQQIRQERQRILNEEKVKERYLREKMDKEMREKDEQLHELLSKHQELEERLSLLNMNETATKQENDRLMKERNELEQMLSGTQLSLKESQSYIDNIKKLQKEESRERARSALKVTEGIVMERENLIRQLDILRDMNRKLRDDQDVAEAMSPCEFPTTPKQREKRGSVLSNYIPNETFCRKSLDQENLQECNTDEEMSLSYGVENPVDQFEYVGNLSHLSLYDEGVVDEIECDDDLIQSNTATPYHYVLPTTVYANDSSELSTSLIELGMPIAPYDHASHTTLRDNSHNKCDSNMDRSNPPRPHHYALPHNIQDNVQIAHGFSLGDEVGHVTAREVPNKCLYDELQQSVLVGETVDGLNDRNEYQVVKLDEASSAGKCVVKETPSQLHDVKPSIVTSGLTQSVRRQRLTTGRHEGLYSGTSSDTEAILPAARRKKPRKRHVTGKNNEIQLNEGSSYMENGAANNIPASAVTDLAKSSSSDVKTQEIPSSHDIIREKLVPRTPQRLFKIVFIGDSGVGKTSFVHQFCNEEFKNTFSATIGVDFQVKSLNVGGEMIALQLWDTAGQERYRSITKQYFRKADGVVIMYSLVCEKSFRNIRNWMTSVSEGVDDDTTLFIVGNKVDLITENRQRAVMPKAARSLAEEYGAQLWETSAVSGSNISDMMETLAGLLKAKEDRQIENSIKLDQMAARKKSNCCMKN